MVVDNEFGGELRKKVVVACFKMLMKTTKRLPSGLWPENCPDIPECEATCPPNRGMYTGVCFKVSRRTKECCVNTWVGKADTKPRFETDTSLLGTCYHCAKTFWSPFCPEKFRCNNFALCTVNGILTTGPCFPIVCCSISIGQSAKSIIPGQHTFNN
jgi:hypothetical protein